MKHIICIALLLIGAQAQAATAFLVSCQGTTSVTGRYIYVGTYNYAGQYFTRAFPSWCPQTVEVF